MNTTKLAAAAFTDLRMVRVSRVARVICGPKRRPQRIRVLHKFLTQCQRRKGSALQCRTARAFARTVLRASPAQSHQAVHAMLPPRASFSPIGIGKAALNGSVVVSFLRYVPFRYP